MSGAGEPKKYDRDGLKRIGDNASAFREKAGAIARQLAFAGIAVVWLFRAEREGAFEFPVGLLRALTLFVGVLAMDLAENATGLLLFGRNRRWILGALDQEWSVAKVFFARDRSIEDPALLVCRPVRWLFWSKLGLLVWAYTILMLFMLARTGTSR